MTSFEKGIKIFAICLGTLIIVTICASLLGVVGIFVGIDDFFRDDEKRITEEIKGNFGNITKLEIDLESTNLEIYEGNEFKVEKRDVNDNIYVTNSGNTVKIVERGGSFWGVMHSGTVVVYVPEDVKLDNLDIDLDAGKVRISGLSSRNLDLEQGAGAVLIRDSSFDYTDINGGAGKIEIENSTLHNLDLDSGVGSVDIKANILGSSKIDADVGSLKVKLLGGKELYRIKAKKGLGSLRIDGSSGEGTFGEGENYIEIDGGVGSIAIDFE